MTYSGGIAAISAGSICRNMAMACRLARLTEGRSALGLIGSKSAIAASDASISAMRRNNRSAFFREFSAAYAVKKTRSKTSSGVGAGNSARSSTLSHPRLTSPSDAKLRNTTNDSFFSTVIVNPHHDISSVHWGAA